MKKKGNKCRNHLFVDGSHVLNQFPSENNKKIQIDEVRLLEKGDQLFNIGAFLTTQVNWLFKKAHYLLFSHRL